MTRSRDGCAPVFVAFDEPTAFKLVSTHTVELSKWDDTASMMNAVRLHVLEYYEAKSC